VPSYQEHIQQRRGSLFLLLQQHWLLLHLAVAVAAAAASAAAVAGAAAFNSDVTSSRTEGTDAGGVM
jgi:hypothetical protein